MAKDLFDVKVTGFYRANDKKKALRAFSLKIGISEKKTIELLKAKSTIKKGATEEECNRIKKYFEGIGIGCSISRTGEPQLSNNLPNNRNKEYIDKKDNLKVNSTNSNHLPWHKKRFKIIISGLVILTILFTFSFNRSNVPVWTVSQKAALCKAYIGSMFSKNPRMIRHYKTGDNGLVYVKYNRAVDNSTWKYTCEIIRSKMIWAGWIDFNSSWGRWRNEDKVTLRYTKSSHTAHFVSPDTKEKIAVKF